ncbi:MAG TPA: fumarate reductase/succinate dehydrogenase flavoprotein subunit, partial [Mycobacterium sp.]|nr:fumarate reductase/succinate dehydrogenase flavoprotein subunit [Mycobacterium sp.]
GLQHAMNDLVGIIRNADELEQAVAKLEEFKARFANLTVEGRRQYNPGWNLAIDLRNMLLVCECVAKAALLRTESRGGHTRDDCPGMDAGWRKTLLVCRAAGSEVIPDIDVSREPQPGMREDLLELFEISELEKYYTDEELAEHPGRRTQ